MKFNEDFSGAILPKSGVPNSTTFGDGDGLVPRRSSVRGATWSKAQAASGKQFFQKGYRGQPHAQCMLVDQTQTSGVACWNDVMDLLINGVTPTN
jgi:hypothetical protein